MSDEPTIEDLDFEVARLKAKIEVRDMEIEYLKQDKARMTEDRDRYRDLWNNYWKNKNKATDDVQF